MTWYDPRMKRCWIVVVVAAAGVFLVLAGCGREAGEATHTGHDDHVASGEQTRSGPPGSTLSFERREVAGELGSYSWSQGGGELSTDAVPPVPPEGEELAVPAGSAVVFDFGGSGGLSSARAEAYPLGGANEVRSRHGFRYLAPGEERSALATEELDIDREGDRAEILIGLPLGRYVVGVYVKTPEGYDASYYYRIAVEGDES